MFAVLTDINKVLPIIETVKSQYQDMVCNIAAVNSPKQFIISGDLQLLSQVEY